MTSFSGILSDSSIEYALVIFRSTYQFLHEFAVSELCPSIHYTIQPPDIYGVFRNFSHKLSSR